MVKEIIRDQKFLMIKSEEATSSDLNVLEDLKDTLNANLKGCVGMAANMIGVSKRILVYVNKENRIDYMINPILIKTSEEYEAEEGCLSLDGTRKVKRFNKIKVVYYNDKFQKRMKSFQEFEAEIIQHEMDHMDGKII